MKSAVKLHPYIYNLLIDGGFDEFSSAHLRDALLKITDESLHVTEARKFIRRQILRLETLGFVRKIGNSVSRANTLYKKTEMFYSTTFISGKIPKNSSLKAFPEKLRPPISDVDAFLNSISKERVIHEAKLAVVLGEIEEYQSLMERFPNRKRDLIELYQQAKSQSATLLGRVTALSKVLGQHTDENIL